MECSRIHVSRTRALDDSALLRLSENFIPRAVLKHMRSGNSSYINEMRSVTIVFAQIQGVDVSTDRGSKVAQDLMVGMQRACYKHEGNLNKFLVDDKGILFLFVFGLPPLVHIDDPVRAIAASFDMIGVLSEIGLRGRFGITTGRVYCGIVGSDMRREYTVMGDTVNLSARLMANAKENTVLVDEATYLRSHEAVNFEKLDPIKVKGKSNSIQIFAPESPSVHGLVMPLLIRHFSRRCWGRQRTDLRAWMSGPERVSGPVTDALPCFHMPWQARTKILGGKSSVLQLRRWRELRQVSEKIKGPGGLLERGGSLLLFGRSGIGKCELAELVISESLGSGFVPVFGTMFARAEDQIRCCVELVQNCLLAIARHHGKADVNMVADEVFADIVGVEKKIDDALMYLGFEIRGRRPSRPSKRSLQHEREGQHNEGIVEIVTFLVTRLSDIQGVLVVLRFSNGTDIFDGLRGSGLDACLFWNLSDRLSQLALQRDRDRDSGNETLTLNPILVVTLARKPPDLTSPEYKVTQFLRSARDLPPPPSFLADKVSEAPDEDPVARPWRLRMQPLTEDAAVELMCHCLGLPTTNGGSLVKRKLREFIIAVSINVPVYIQECIEQMMLHGYIQVTDGECSFVQDLSTVNIAEWVQTSMVGGTISQLESLGSAKMHIMKLATVFEGPFSPLDLAAANRMLFGNVHRFLAFYDQAKLLHSCSLLVNHGFLERLPMSVLTPPADGAPARLPRWTVSNSLFRKVAGSMLLNSQKMLIKRAVLVERALNVELPKRLRVSGQQSARRKSHGSDPMLSVSEGQKAGLTGDDDETSPLDPVQPGKEPERLQDVLISACALGQMSVVQEVLRLKNDAVDLNKAVDSTGCTPLHFACASGDVDVVHALCERNANVHARSSQNETPLQIAAQRGHLEVVQYLCEARDALVSGSKEEEVWERLLKDVEHEDELPSTLAPTFQAPNFLSSGWDEILEKRADVHGWLQHRFNSCSSGEEATRRTTSSQSRRSRGHDRAVTYDDGPKYLSSPTAANLGGGAFGGASARRRTKDGPAWRSKVRVWLHSRAVLILMLANLAVALYTPDALVAIGVPGNLVNDLVLTFAGLLFVTEIALLSICDASYLFSFFFFMDIIGTLSLVTDLTYMLAISANEPILDTGGSQDLTFFRASRTAKVGARAGRLSRLVKLMRVLTRNKEGDGPQELKHISNQLTNVLSKRVACLTIIMVICMPMFTIGTYPTGDFSMQVWTETFYNRASKFTSPSAAKSAPAMSFLLERFESFYQGEPYGPFRICFLPEAGAPAAVAGCHPLTGFFEPERKSFQLDVVQGFVVASFDYSEPAKAEARVGIVLISVVVVMMCMACVLLNYAAAELAVKPLQRMLASIKGSAQAIFSTVSVLDSKGDNDGFADIMDGEVALLERVVKKIATLAELSRKNQFDEEAMNDLRGEDAGVIAMAVAPTARTPQQRREMGDRGRPIAVTATMHWQLEEIGIKYEDLNSWEFNVLEMEVSTMEKISYWMLMNNPGSCAHAEHHVDSKRLGQFVEEVRRGYRDNPYHNFMHAVDVTHAVFRYSNLMQAELIFPAIELFSVLVAAISHDLGHVGWNNAFLVETQHDLAIRYNDRSPLENLHCCKLFELLSDVRFNIFSGIQAEDYRVVRKIIIMVILHTDLTQHAAMVKELELLFEMHSKVFENSNPTLTQPEVDVLSSAENKKLVAKVLLHAADTSNPTKPWELGKLWAWRVLDEYAAQGDREKSLGIPVQMLNDRDKVNRPNSQIGFIEFIITPFIAAEVKIFRSWFQVSVSLEENLLRWEALWIDECKPSKEERDKVKDRVRKMGQKLNNNRFREFDKESRFTAMDR
eukprot:TRINITY_DN25834_c0_g1_i1.p1 TRINITY_DN25834_c0_g1~~TRINITY_DN25834_c0_g1_i1.p1  ORF type:complete len:2072 (-),score=304.76 TRINITY_DN25834_c0_g1_i1:130-5685(-)